MWQGFRSYLPDGLPVISASREVRGVHYLFGFSSSGMINGAAASRALARLWNGEAPEIDMTPYAIDRFQSPTLGQQREYESKVMTTHLMNAYTRAELEAVRGEGCYLFDAEGRQYLDFLSGVAVNALGHCHPALVDALCKQAHTLWHASNLIRVPDQERLADRICAASFADQAFFTNSGGEAIDFSLKLVRRYFKTTPTPERFRVITFSDAFHGRTMAAIAAGGQPKLTQGYEPVVPGFDNVPFGDFDALRAAIGPETAAILLEPIQGEGGIRAFPNDMLVRIRQICDEHGLLLVLDEVQTGFGRTGKLFAFERAGIVPDIVAAGKGIGAGYPLGVVLAVAKVSNTITPGSHGSTLGGSSWRWPSATRCST